MNTPETPDHLANSPVEASEAAKAAALDICDIENICIGGDYNDPTARAVQPNKVAAIITRHFQPVLEENAEQKRWLKAAKLDLDALHTQLATLNKELETTKQRADQEEMAAAKYAKTIFELRAQLAQAEATLIEAMGRDAVEGCSLHEMCALIVSQRDNARTCEDTYKGKVEAMREAIPATVYRAFPTVDDRECHMAKLIHDLRSALTPGAGERTT